MRPLMIVFVVALCAFSVASPAAATKPDKYDWTWTETFTTDVCPFPITEAMVLNATETDFFDSSGAMTGFKLHAVEQDTFTANGKTLVSLPYTFNVHVLLDSNGNTISSRGTGVIMKVLLPDGSTFMSAGQVDFLTHGIPVFTPDKGHSGNLVKFCAAFAP